LYVRGVGDMKSFSNDHPWYNVRTVISTVVIENGVTSIGERAFHSCTNLTSITIPESIANIGHLAFFGTDRDILSVTVLNPVPFDINEISIIKTILFLEDGGATSVYPDILYVPCGSLTAYQNAPVWQEFGTIIEMCSIYNTQANFSCPGQVTVTYDLDTSQPTDVILYYSHNKHDWLVAQTVTGDLTAQTSGTGKTISWNNSADNVRYGKFYFKLETQQPPEPEPECVWIGGVCWATHNVDAPGTFTDNSEDPGMIYQWNRSKGWPAIGDVTGWDRSDPFYGIVDYWEMANNVCPSGYRVPTTTEIVELIASGSQWTTRNGVNGCIFGSGDNTIFLPAAGFRDRIDGEISGAGWGGFYWSNAYGNSNGPYTLGFNSYSGADISTIHASGPGKGISVRCVAE